MVAHRILSPTRLPISPQRRKYPNCLPTASLLAPKRRTSLHRAPEKDCVARFFGKRSRGGAHLPFPRAGRAQSVARGDERLPVPPHPLVEARQLSRETSFRSSPRFYACLSSFAKNLSAKSFLREFWYFIYGKATFAGDFLSVVSTLLCLPLLFRKKSFCEIFFARILVFYLLQEVHPHSKRKPHISSMKQVLGAIYRVRWWERQNSNL